MSEYRDDVVGAAESMLRGFGATTSEPARFPGAAWTAMVSSGFDLLSVPESSGGAGGDVADLLALVELAARTGVDVPLAEHALLAGWAWASSGQRVPGGMVTAASSDRVVAVQAAGGWLLTGEVAGVPWLRDAGHAVILIAANDRAPALVALLDMSDPPQGLLVEPASNIAGEPRDTLRLREAFVSRERVLEAAPGVTPGSFRERGALARTVQIAGAARTVLALTLQYAHSREQFGRPISKFQVVQHGLARLAEDVSAIGMAADAAAALFSTVPGSDHARLGVTAAKSYASAAAGDVAAAAHQLHGALGFTAEHRLGWFTKRLWSWRDEFGNEAEWNVLLGRQVLKAGTPWAAITGATVPEA